ncbi:putative vacuolar protein sorting-associated protein TDA6 [Madurella mycetomatis]|uniref:Vacuolar protein sorting-associated protein TDA6 n=1 Tax=Madurella mycetomatis TaxID=100816 RepID=A0A175W7U4_9PEZI|nr:putative vacuolar protein sorting-associated protein TDA6 [Madurella mycetomatis]
MIYNLRRATIASFSLASLLFLIWLLPRLLNPTPPNKEERERDKHWVNSSPYWLDRQACRWLSLCGIQHIRWDAPALPDDGSHSTLDAMRMLALGWSEERIFIEKPETSTWETAPVHKDLKRRRRRATTASGSAKILEEVPDYVLAHAPLVHLYSGENFWPSDIAEHIRQTRPFKNGSLVDTGKPLHLGNLASLNAGNGTVFLTSHDDVEMRPEWLHSRKGFPVPFEDDDEASDGPSGEDKEHWGSHGQPQRPQDGTTWWDADRKHPPHRIAPPNKFPERKRRLRGRRSVSNSQHPIVGSAPQDGGSSPSGYAKSPAVLILVDKGAGILDAFWFFFYSYNLGQTVLKIRFGNHVGDWEHCMVRFQHGVPRAMFLSEHAGGKAYAWRALEKRPQKDGKPARPVIYSAVGSHAMYASPGMHPYVLPFKLLKDITDKGPLWDPALNNYAYWYDYEADQDEAQNPPTQERTSLTPAASNPDVPTSWFHFEGPWGDDVYPLSDRRQWRLFGEYHYITGPLGPKAKWLDRRKVCQTEKCTILDSIEEGKKSAWY